MIGRFNGPKVIHRRGPRQSIRIFASDQSVLLSSSQHRPFPILFKQTLFFPENAKMSSCANCGSPATKRCSGCHSVFLCSQDCQRNFWKAGHKDVCRPPPPDRVTSKLPTPARAPDALDDGSIEIDMADIMAAMLFGKVVPVGQGVGAAALGNSFASGLKMKFKPNGGRRGGEDAKDSKPTSSSAAFEASTNDSPTSPRPDFSTPRTVDRITERKNNFPVPSKIKKNFGPSITVTEDVVDKLPRPISRLGILSGACSMPNSLASSLPKRETT